MAEEALVGVDVLVVVVVVVVVEELPADEEAVDTAEEATDAWGCLIFVNFNPAGKLF